MECGSLSLIIPTFNRPGFLQRLLNYYSELRAPYEIVVADSSSGLALEENRRTIDGARNILNLNHQTYPADTNPYAKLVSAVQSLQRPYAAVCADDDFIIPQGVAKCAEFLENNPTYSIAHGYATAVLVTDQDQIRSASNYPQRSIESENPADRLEDHLDNHTATYYSVHRRDQLAANLKRAMESTVDYRFGELLPSCLSLIQGKAKKLEVLYMVRQADLRPPKYGENMMGWRELSTMADFPERYAGFRDCLANELAHVTNCSLTEANAVVDRAFGVYLAANVAIIDDDSGHNLSDRAKRLIRFVPRATRVAITDGELLETIRNPRRSYQKAVTMEDEMSLPSLLNTRSPFHADFIRVYRHLAAAQLAASNNQTVDPQGDLTQ